MTLDKALKYAKTLNILKILPKNTKSAWIGPLFDRFGHFQMQKWSESRPGLDYEGPGVQKPRKTLKNAQ